MPQSIQVCALGQIRRLGLSRDWIAIFLLDSVLFLLPFLLFFLSFLLWAQSSSIEGKAAAAAPILIGTHDVSPSSWRLLSCTQLSPHCLWAWMQVSSWAGVALLLHFPCIWWKINTTSEFSYLVKLPLSSSRGNLYWVLAKHVTQKYYKG